ncbi:uncharacterized protein KZ484_011001 [Pholidichthys leucotaenia]
MADVPQQNDFNQEEVLGEQQFLDQERNLIVVQVEADCSQIKEEREDVCIIQEGEHFGLKQEPQTFEDVPQQNDFSQEEVLDEQQFLDQERNFIVVQVEADCSQIKEEQDDVCISQEGEHFGLKQEPQTFEDALPLHDRKEEEVLTVQQFCNQERNSSLNQEKQDAAPVKKEEEELCTSQEEEHFGLKQETDTFMVTPTDEDNDKSKIVPNSEQLLSHTSPDTESQDQGAVKPLARWEEQTSGSPSGGSLLERLCFLASRDVLRQRLFSRTLHSSFGCLHNKSDNPK